MSNIRVLICDGDEEFIKILKKRLGNDFTVTFTSSGIKAKELLESESFDILLMDFILRGMDGITLLNYIKDKSINIKPIVLTYFLRKPLIKEALNLGVWYCFSKDSDPVTVIDRIRTVAGALKKEKIKRNLLRNSYFMGSEIERFLMDLGFNPNTLGYKYLSYAVSLCLENRIYLRNIMGMLYPEIARNFLTTDAKVESALRSSVKKCYDKSNKFNEFLMLYSVSNSKKPTNGTIIKYIVHYLDTLREEENNPYKYHLDMFNFKINEK